MTTIKATCPTCGDVSLTPDDIDLHLARERAEGFYEFPCPDCAARVRQPADHRVVSLLLSGGVEPRPIGSPGLGWRLPRTRLRDRFDHPQLTRDDLLDFHLFLQQDGWFDRILVDDH